MTDILVGWKEISAYLHVSERTAQRYLEKRQLPIEKDPAGHPIIKKSAASEWQFKEQSI